MNLNDFVVPNNTTRSVKLNARNLQKLQLDTTTLASERTNMEEKLEQLRENMSKEKEERGHFRDLRWKFGQYISSDSNPQANSFKRTNDNKIQKLSAGKLKIRILKDEPLTAPPPSAPSPSVPNSGLGMTKRSRVKGAKSRQCEIKTAELTDTQDQVISQDISCFQRQINPGSFPSIYNTDSSTSADSNHSIAFPKKTTREDERPENGTKGEEKQTNILPHYSQVLVVKHEEEKASGVIEDNKSELADSVFTGQYSEEESARSFQEALLQWRKERRDGKGNLVTTDLLWTPMGSGGINRNALVSATSTQTDLPPGKEAERQKKEGAEGKLTVKLEFSENSLTYMDRLLLKKHRRTPVESPSSLAFGKDLKSVPTTDTEEEMTSSLTAEEENFRQYCSSLFNIPVSEDRTEPQVPTLASCLVIEVLDEISRDMKTVSLSEQKFDNNRMISKVEHSSPCSTQLSRPSASSVQLKTGKRPQRPHNQNSINDNLDKASHSDCRQSACATVGTSKKSTQISASNSSRSISCPTLSTSKANCGSPHFFPSLMDSQFKTHKPFKPSDIFPTDISIVDGTTSAIPEEHPFPSSSTSFPLRSTFSVSPSTSTQCVLLPKVDQSTPQQNVTEKTQSSQLFAETISSRNPYETAKGNLISPQQFQLPSSDPDCLLLDNQFTNSLSPGTAEPQPTSQALETIISIAKPVPSNGLPYSCYTSVLRLEDAPVLMSLVSDDHKTTPSYNEGHCTSSYLVSDVTDNPVETDEDKEHLDDSGDKMSSDSLCLTPPEEDSCEEEAQIQGLSPRDYDSFRPAEKNMEKDLQTEDTEQRPQKQMVMQKQTAGFGSEQFCDLDGFSPLGLDTVTGFPASPEQTHYDGLHTCQFSVHDSDSTEFGLTGCPLSQASKAIMEICSADLSGCEDPDVDSDMSTRMLHSMEHELRLLATTQCMPIQALELESGDSERENQDESHHFKWGGTSKEQNQEEETADQQSVLLLP